MEKRTTNRKTEEKPRSDSGRWTTKSKTKAGTTLSNPESDLEAQTAQIVEAWQKILNIRLNANHIRQHLDHLAEWKTKPKNVIK